MTTSIPQEQKENVPATATKARVAKPRAPIAPSKGKPARKVSRAKQAVPARRGSKTAKIVDLLKRPAREGHRMAAPLGPRLFERHTREEEGNAR